MQKKCITCKKEQNLNDFYKHKRYEDGRENVCKICRSKRRDEVKSGSYLKELKLKQQLLDKGYIICSNVNCEGGQLPQSIDNFYKDERRKYNYANECRKCLKNRTKENRLDQRVQRYNYKGKQFDKDSFIELLEKQKYKCPICFNNLTENGRGTHIDHDHKINEVREILCKSCNNALGLLKEDIKIVKSLLKYIRKWQKL